MYKSKSLILGFALFTSPAQLIASEFELFQQPVSWQLMTTSVYRQLTSTAPADLNRNTELESHRFGLLFGGQIWTKFDLSPHFEWQLNLFANTTGYEASYQWQGETSDITDLPNRSFFSLINGIKTSLDYTEQLPIDLALDLYYMNEHVYQVNSDTPLSDIEGIRRRYYEARPRVSYNWSAERSFHLELIADKGFDYLDQDLSYDTYSEDLSFKLSYLGKIDSDKTLNIDIYRLSFTTNEVFNNRDRFAISANYSQAFWKFDRASVGAAFFTDNYQTDRVLTDTRDGRVIGSDKPEDTGLLLEGYLRFPWKDLYFFSEGQYLNVDSDTEINRYDYFELLVGIEFEEESRTERPRYFKLTRPIPENL